jgi:hypothetical protein
MTRRHEFALFKGKRVEVTHLCGPSRLTAPYLVRMMKDVPLGHAGLGGTNVDTVTSDDWDGCAERKRIYDHAMAEFKYTHLCDWLHSAASGGED